MQSPIQVSPREFVESLNELTEAYLKSVMEAVNLAPMGSGWPAAKSRSATCPRTFAAGCFRRPGSSVGRRRKPLFPPPHETVVDPVTHQPVSKRLRNKGLQDTHWLTANGHIQVFRRWWHSAKSGSVAPADEYVDRIGETGTPAVREMVCRLNRDGINFDQTAENLARTAQVKMSGEQLRQIVLAEGRRVLAAQEAHAIRPAFTAADCPADPTQPDGPTRLYHGLDGVMVPVIGEHEKAARRETVEAQRTAQGKPLDDLPPRRTGCDEAFTEFKTIVFYDEPGEHWHESRRYCRRFEAVEIVRHEAARLHFSAADARVANVDGADWIRAPLEADPEGLPLDGLGLDFYHLGENVHQCRREVFGAEDAAGKTWASGLLHTFKHEAYGATWEPLLKWRVTLSDRSSSKKASADWLLNFVQERQAMIAYPTFRSHGWQIGSDPTESRCKTSTSRLTGRGRRWNPKNAEAVAAHRPSATASNGTRTGGSLNQKRPKKPKCQEKLPNPFR
jgi:hypothetical protein